MIFNSLTFAIFLASVLLVARSRLGWTLRKGFLLLVSYAFYAAWNPPFVVLLWISTVADWFLARKLHVSDDARVRKLLVGGSLAVNLGLLSAFKYGDFLLGIFQGGLDRVGVGFEPIELGLILPVGISFYTFQTLSYTIDVYRRKIEPSRSALDFALFVTFFPQLVAGPIVRAADFLPQLKEPRKATPQQLGWGLSLLSIGLFQKTVLADTLFAPVADKVYGNAGDAAFLDAWMGTLAFSGQIFCDFAGYSACAIGVALALGFVLPDNFRMPYAAIGFSDFWRRWHISLSSWLRDYLYISLGGNRAGRTRTTVNLMITMLLGGLWHGAAWRFVAWGALHGAYLGVERVLRRHLGHLAVWSLAPIRLALGLLTFLLVSYTWLYFRASDWDTAATLNAAMFSPSLEPTLLKRFGFLRAGVGISLVVGGHWLLRDHTVESLWARIPAPARAILLALLLSAVFLAPDADRPFIYFQF